MATRECQTIRQLKALLRMVVAIYFAITLSSAHANDLTCESAHLSIPAPNLEQIASNLAKLRLQIYQMPSSPEKLRADQEFKAKYAEFELLVGDKEPAKDIFQHQISKLSPSMVPNEAKESSRIEKEQEERERVALDPASKARKMIFHEIRPGSFKMGDVVKVFTEITKPFEMMDTPVTQLMWARLKLAMGERKPELLNPSHFKNGDDSVLIPINGFEIQMKPDHPVESVSWDDVQKFIEGLNQLSRSSEPSDQALLASLIPGHEKDDLYSLPTEAQWEFVLRDRGSANRYWFDQYDQSNLHQYAWFGDNSGGHTHAVATLLPRLIDGKPFYDLEGNVFEWVQDFWRQELSGGLDPRGPEQGYFRGIRGGSWSSHSSKIRSGHRESEQGFIRKNVIGFRLVKTRP